MAHTILILLNMWWCRSDDENYAGWILDYKCLQLQLTTLLLRNNYYSKWIRQKYASYVIHRDTFTIKIIIFMKCLKLVHNESASHSYSSRRKITQVPAMFISKGKLTMCLSWHSWHDRRETSWQQCFVFYTSCMQYLDVRTFRKEWVR